MEEVKIPPRDVYRLYLDMDQIGKTIVWNFHTRKKNISFGLFYQPADAIDSLHRHFLSSDKRVKAIHSKELPLSRSSDDVSSSSTSAHHTMASPASFGNSSLRKVLRRNGKNSLVRGNSSKSVNEMPLVHPTSTIPSDAASLTSAASSHAPSFITTPSSPNHIPKWPTGSPASSFSLPFRPLPSSQPNDLLLTEILPIRHYNSAKVTIKGFHKVEKPGVYILFFDNRFSRNTSKLLTYFVNVEENFSGGSEPTIAGWLLKKKRKKMQGWAKRWFKVEDGILSYAKEPAGIVRGSLSLLHSAINIDNQRNMVNIDSGYVIYHLKALKEDDMERWFKVLKDVKEHYIEVTSPTSSDKPSPLFEAHLNLFTTEMMNQLSSAKGISNQLKLELDISKASSAVVLSSLKEFKLDETLIQLSETLEKCSQILQTGSARLKNYYQLGNKEISQDTFSSEWKEKKHSSFVGSLSMDAKGASSQKSMSPLSRHAKCLSTTESILSTEDEYFDASEPPTIQDDNASVISEPIVDEPEPEVVVEDDDDEDEDDDDDGLFASQVTFPAGSVDNVKVELSSTGDSFIRRCALPSVAVESDISFVGILKKNVGKDLSTVSMPVAMNEPLNLLQKLCEELEYSELLDKANQQESSVDRMMYVAAFAISAYASSANRGSRKPFNPLLGETYECVRNDKGFKFISEKVCHHPPVMACHASSPNFIFWQDSKVKSKFWGKSMEFTPIGTVHVILPKSNDHYTWNKVTSCMKNLISGNRYLEHYGDMLITNHSTGDICKVTFEGGSFFGDSSRKIRGIISNSSQQTVYVLSGKWNEIVHRELSNQQLEILWQAQPLLPNSQEMYGFGRFAMELNELTPDLRGGVLPSTDTRLRPDQRLLEEGRVDEAEETKIRLEQNQREARRRREQDNEDWRPLWFEEKLDPLTQQSSWVFNNQYWDVRDKKGFNATGVSLW